MDNLWICAETDPFWLSAPHLALKWQRRGNAEATPGQQLQQMPKRATLIVRTVRKVSFPVQKNITAKRISGRTTFKMLFVGFLAFHVISTLLVAVLVVIGVLPLEPTNPQVNETVAPLLLVGAYLVAGVVFSPVWVGALWLSIWPGLWLYSLVRTMDLAYVPPKEHSSQSPNVAR